MNIAATGASGLVGSAFVPFLKSQQLKVAPPRIAPLSEGGSRGSNKRCRNTKLLETGYTFQYPSFREGYAAELAELAAEAQDT